MKKKQNPPLKQDSKEKRKIKKEKKVKKERKEKDEDVNENTSTIEYKETANKTARLLRLSEWLSYQLPRCCYQCKRALTTVVKALVITVPEPQNGLGGEGGVGFRSTFVTVCVCVCAVLIDSLVCAASPVSSTSAEPGGQRD